MMKIKKKINNLLSVFLSISMILGGGIQAHATDAIITESNLEDETVEAVSLSDEGIDAQDDGEKKYETVEVSYNQSSTYFVTIPKSITLGADKRAAYSVKVEGDIVANKQVCVVPVDEIEDTEVFDFYMADQTAGSTKEDVVAEVSQAKFYWNHEETKAGYEETDNYVAADNLSAGRWKGTFQMEISMRTDPTHIHNYVGEVTKESTCTEKGEKTYTCDCGDSYTEETPAKGHHFEKGECTDCGEKDPDHKHSYTEKVTKEPTCTETGEKTYSCDCGDSYTEEIPAKGHHFVDGECEHCGEKDPDYHKHSYTETVTKEPNCTEKGEKTYTCDCGDSYTEEIPAKGHHFVDGECGHCGEKDPDYHKHNYTEEITKEATCTEEGEKTYTCDCGDSYTEKIPATDHSYIDGVCGECGKVKGEYTFHFNSWNVINSPAANAEYEFADNKLDDGEKIHLPEVNDACGAVEGWQYAKKEGVIGMRNDVLQVGTFSSTINVKSCGTMTDSSTGVKTDDFWKQTAQSGEIVITEPSVISLIVTRDVGLNRNDCGYSASVTLSDLDNDKQYSLLNLANTVVRTYDYGNVVITANSTTGKSQFNYSYSNNRTYYHYSIYLEPGTYKLYAAGSIGTSTNGKREYSVMILDLGSSGYGSRCDLYSLHDLTEGMTFDASEIYTSEGNKNIYCVPKIVIKDHHDNEYVSRSATCTADGTKQLSCTTCKVMRYETIPATGHDYEAVTRDATCTATGSITYTCKNKNCSDKYTETLEALGHDYVDSVCTRCGNINYVTTNVMNWMSDRAYNKTSYKYSDTFTIEKDMVDKEYLAIGCTLYNSSTNWTHSHYSGSVYLQKQNEETGAWSNVKTYTIANTIKGPSYKIEGLESGNYRIYGYFKNSSTTNYYQMAVRATTYILG